MRKPYFWASSLAFTLLATLLTGCGTGLDSTTAKSPTPVSGGTPFFSGVVHGGQNPISQSTVQLWQVGTSGYATGARTLGNSVQTQADGSFVLTGQYSCSSGENGNNTLVYLTASGGDPGLGSTNSAIKLIAPIGYCGSLTPNTFIEINEVTTVAAAYALSQFMSPTGSIGSFGASSQGMANAFAAVNNLVDTSQGTARTVTPAGNGIVPQAEIYTLANILSTCVNSPGPGSTTCTALFADAPPPNAVTPTTLSAALTIAQNPANHVHDLFTIPTPTAPFQPALTPDQQPNDWTLALSYATGGNNPAALALDSLGDLWIANYGAPFTELGTGQANSSLSLVNTLGVPASNSPFSNPINVYGATGVAVDRNDNAWIVNRDNSTANEFGYDPTLHAINTEIGPLTGLGLVDPIRIAIDASNNLWFDNVGGEPDYLTVLNSANNYGGTGNPVVNNLSTTGLFNASYAFAFDNAGNAWAVNDLADDLPGTLFEFSPAGALLSPPNGFPGGGLNQPAGIAIDSTNHVWVTDYADSILSEFDPNGSPTVTTPYSGGGLGGSLAPAIDGNNNVWIADQTANQLTEFNSSGQPITPSTGYQGGNLSGATALAIDESGNLWIANNSPVTVNSAPQTVTEFIGLAAPVVTPFSAAVAQAQLGVKPGTLVPVTITTTFLPQYVPSTGSFGIPYHAQLYASGGSSGSYIWSSPFTLPSGFSLSAGGEINGETRTSDKYPLTVYACDAQDTHNCAHKVLQLEASNFQTGGNPGALNGSYALLFNGIQSTAINPSAGAVYGDALVASVTFNSDGTLTGEADLQSPQGGVAQLPVFGYYYLGSDNRGTFQILLPDSTFAEFAFSVGNFNGDGIAQTIRFIEFDNTDAANAASALGSGIGKLQTTAAFTASTLTQKFVFGLQGETPCTNYHGTNTGCAQTVAPFGAVAAAGFLNSESHGFQGKQDAAAVGKAYHVTIQGQFNAPDSSGRGTCTLTASGNNIPAAPTDFVYYIVNAGEIVLMSSDDHSTTTLLSGDALAQSGAFSDSTISGNYIAWAEQAHGGDGLSAIAPQTDVGIYDFAVNSGNTVTLTGDENKGGQLNLNQSIGTSSYSIDNTGRLTLGAGTDVVLYLANATQGFGVTIPDSNSSSIGMITFQQQTATTFSNTSIDGAYSFASIPPPAVLTSDSSGVFLSTGTGSAAVTIDNAQPFGLLTAGESATYNVSVSSNGRSVNTNSDGGSSVLYVINSTTGVIMDTDINSSTGTISVAQQ